MNPHALWKGFELSPQGCLLDQTINLSGQMGIAYERSCDYYKDFHVHDRLMLVCPRGACAMEVRSRNPNARHRIDSCSVLLVPAEVEHDDEGVSSIYDTFALYPSQALMERVARTHGSPESLQLIPRDACIRIRRTPWLEQLLQRYFVLRILSSPADPAQFAFFEEQIAAEVLSILKGDRRKRTAPFPGRDDSIAARALRFIEANLFSDLNLVEIAGSSSASVSSLLRHFRSATSQTPSAYIRNRRLEEGRRLLEKGEHPVGDVALLVGYQNFGAFSEAFKAKYRKPPSAFLKLTPR